MPSLSRKITLLDLQAARRDAKPLAMLTCYDFTTARLMQEAGVPLLLVGDSAANVILGHPTTLPVPLSFMIEITAAVRRGAPLAYLVADMPFGSYHGSVSRGVANVCRMVKRTNCDAVKIEAGPQQVKLVEALAGAGVAVMAHLGLRPQAVGVMGGYRYQGRTADEATDILALALQLEQAGASSLLLEAVPPEVARAVVDRGGVPVIGCGAGPACHGSVIVTQDGLGLTPSRPRFAPELADIAGPMREAFSSYVEQVGQGRYPAPEHNYSMPADQRQALEAWLAETDRDEF